MYVCMHACKYYVCMYVWMHACKYVCMYVCMHAGMRVCMYVCMHACMYVCMCACVYVCMYICMYVCIYACMYVYLYVCMYICMYVCVYVCMYVCVCTYVCMFVCIYVSVCCISAKNHNTMWNIKSLNTPNFYNPFLARTFSVRPATTWWWHTNLHLTFIFSLLFWIQRVLILMWYLWNVHTTCSTRHSKNMINCKSVTASHHYEHLETSTVFVTTSYNTSKDICT